MGYSGSGVNLHGIYGRKAIQTEREEKKPNHAERAEKGVCGIVGSSKAPWPLSEESDEHTNKTKIKCKRKQRGANYYYTYICQQNKIYLFNNIYIF